MPDFSTIIAGDQKFVRIESVKWLNPSLGEALARIKPHPGRPRTEMTVPIAPSEALTDALVFEAPSGPSPRYYLPRYALGVVATDLGTQYQVSLTRQDPGARLAVVVRATMAPEVQFTAPDATPLPHDVVAVLGYELPGGGGLKREWTLSDRRELTDGIELSVTLPTLGDRDEVYQALTTTSFSSSLIVRRTCTVAIPTAEVIATDDPGDPPPKDGRLPRVRFERASARPRLAMATNPVLFNTSILKEAVTGVAIDPPIVAWNRLPHEATTTTAYRETTRALDQTLTPAPFVFPKELHPYIYGDITGSSGQGGLVLEQLAHAGRYHSYYYAAGRPELVYFLPDAFVLTRTPEEPHDPMMSVSFDSPDGRPESTTVNVAFAASATASPERLTAATAALAAKTGLDPARLDLQPFLADSSRLTLRVALPGSAGASTLLEGARIDLRTALSAGFTIPLAAFQSMIDRLAGAVPTLFDGEVEVRLDRPDRASERIPVSADLSAPDGSLPDPAALLHAICDDTTSFLTRDITLQAPAQLFSAPPDGGTILALVVEIGPAAGGLTQTVQLTETAPVGVTQLNIPLVNLVVPGADGGDYRYRVSTVRIDRVAEGEWRTDTKTIKWIVSGDLT
ncbi:MAG: hypothetical protein QM713_01165 [Arachnia sp.]